MVVKQKEKREHFFQTFATKASSAAGTKWAFLLAALTIVVWALLGPIFHYSDTWQLVINTATTVVTFLMVFLIQNTQNRDAKALHLKLDELIHAITSAKNDMIDIEKLPDEELKRLSDKYQKMREDCDETEVPTATESPGLKDSRRKSIIR